MTYDLGKSAEKHLKLAAEAIATAREKRGLEPDPDGCVEDAIAVLTAISHPQICLALDDAVKLIRGWHGMKMTLREEAAAWKIYRDNAPEMQSILLALEKAQG
jgi:hypothetical protein